jgi:hypothetical protein
MRHLWKLLTAFAVLGLGFVSSPALAGVPKVVFLEEFGATW